MKKSDGASFRVTGSLVAIVGMLGLYFALTMEVGVETAFGKVANLSLMQQQQNYMMLFALVLVIGIVLVAAGEIILRKSE